MSPARSSGDSKTGFALCYHLRFLFCCANIENYLCRCSSVVEHSIRNRAVVSSNLIIGFPNYISCNPLKGGVSAFILFDRKALLRLLAVVFRILYTVCIRFTYAFNSLNSPRFPEQPLHPPSPPSIACAYPLSLLISSSFNHDNSMRAGKRIVKIEPRPNSLSTVISPPIIKQKWRLIVNPKPVPPYLRVVEASPCIKA
jgi:hypothetical protein